MSLGVAGRRTANYDESRRIKGKSVWVPGAIPMAKKKTTKKAINKSEEIRKYLARNPTAGPKQVQTALAEKGIEVSSGLVGRVKNSNTKQKKASTNAKRKQPVGTNTAKKMNNRSKEAEPRTRDELRQAGDLMRQAMDLVIKAGAKEAKQLVHLAEGMVRTMRSRK